MIPLLRNFNEKLFKKNDKLLLAISGGIDSMVMFHRLRELSQTMNLTLMVAHVDHQKRKTSDLDCEFVRETCSKYGIPFFTTALEYTDIDNFHNYARTLRYEFFYKIAKENSIKKIVLAHNQNDNAETILMRLTRGSSLEGYRGILDVSNYKDLTIIRPLLNVSRQEILQYQKENNIEYREDESNQMDDYTRNRFRHHILPLLEKENPKFLDKFSQFSEYLDLTYELVENAAKKYIKNSVLIKKDSCVIDSKSLQKLEKILQIEVIKRVVNLKTNNEIELSFQNLRDVLSIVNSKKPNLELDLDQNLFIYKSYGRLIIQSDKNIKTDYEYKVSSPEKINTIANDFVIISKKRSKYSGNIYKLCYNNLDQLFPLTVRNRRDGDKVKISNGTKKVKDLFIDKKVPLEERNSVPLILNKNGEIVWIPNYYKKKTIGNNEIFIIYQKG